MDGMTRTYTYQKDWDYHPVLLKFALLSQGIIVSDEVRATIGNKTKEDWPVGAIGKHAMDVILKPGKVYVGIPMGSQVSKDLLKDCPYRLEQVDSKFMITKKPAKVDQHGKEICLDPDAKSEPIMEVELFPRPHYYELKTSNGISMRELCPMASDFVPGTIDPRCDFWGHRDVALKGMECKYCGIGPNWTEGREAPIKKTPQDYVETIAEARKYPHFHHGPVYSCGTFPAPDRGHILHAEYIKAVKDAFPDNYIRLTIAPPEEEHYVDLLFQAGADLVGYNYEVFDEKLYSVICRGKWEILNKKNGHQHYDRILKYGVRKFGEGRLHANLIVGTEPIRSTVAGMRHLCEMGVLPRLFVLAPLLNTAMEHQRTPSVPELVYVYRKWVEIAGVQSHLDHLCAGCDRMLVSTRLFDGLVEEPPEITDKDLERAGFSPDMVEESAGWPFRMELEGKLYEM